MKTLNYNLKGLAFLVLSLLGGMVIANNIKVSNISLEVMNASQN